MMEREREGNDGERERDDGERRREREGKKERFSLARSQLSIRPEKLHCVKKGAMHTAND